MELPEGLQELLVDTEGEGDVSLYGLKQASRVWNETIDARLKAMRFQTAAIAEKSRIKDLGRARFILGIAIDYDMERNASTISQRAYTESVINRFGQENTKFSLTPLDPSVHLTKANHRAKMKSKQYRSFVGSLMYLVCGTRPDIAVAVAKLSRFLDIHGQRHWDAGIKVVRYLLKTKDVVITYDGRMGTELTAFSDADWAGNRDDRR
ncbi:putative transposable element [Phytophthora palmivora]|uniref:Transposable element n=1 Tax=Phytophthora palmivora TaxID=4796 RepID=A0A2P4YG04_9STRA|nr:putative transposable element [Phytophthora palmivora]